MKKVLFLVTQSEYGGAQRYIFEIAKGLDKTKYDVLVAAGQGDGELFRKLEKENMPFARLEHMKRSPLPWQIILSIWEIRCLVKKKEPDVLFLCSTTAGLLGSIAAISSKTKVIYRIGGWAFQDPRAFWKNWLILWLEKITSPLKDAVIVNSEKDRVLALRHKVVPENKLFKIHNGLDKNSLNFLSKEEARQALSLQNGPVVGTVANFYQTKGLSYLIEAAREVNAVFCIIGEGKERDKLESSIKKYGLEKKVILPGRMPDAYKYLKAFDVFVLPSLKEGFPWIILEALATEVPVVATKVGALPEIIEEEFLVSPGNSRELTQKINRVLEYPVKAVAKKNFSLSEMISKTDKVLKRLTA